MPRHHGRTAALDVFGGWLGTELIETRLVLEDPGNDRIAAVQTSSARRRASSGARRDWLTTKLP